MSDVLFAMGQPHALSNQCEIGKERGSTTSVSTQPLLFDPFNHFLCFSTGVHTVADIFCMGCNDRVGWYYHKAADLSQKYKEGKSLSRSWLNTILRAIGKYLLEREKIVKENNWKLDQ